MWLVASLLVAAVVLKFVAAITDSLEIGDWVTAFIAAIVLTVLEYLVTLVMPSMQLRELWQIGLFLLLANVIAVALTSLAVPRMKLNGVIGLVLAAVFLTIANFILPPVLTQTPRLF